MEAPSANPLIRLKKRLGRLRRRFALDTFDVFVRPVPEGVTSEPPPGYTIRWGTPEDIARCQTFHTELDEEERRTGIARLGLGHMVVLGLAGELVVFSMWVNPRALNVPGLMKRALEPGQWFIYKAFTSPEHRGKKLYEGGMRFVLAEMRAAGRRELVGYAHVKKAVSRKGLAALEFASAGRVTRLDWPWLKRVFLSKELQRRFPRQLARSGAIPPHRT